MPSLSIILKQWYGRFGFIILFMAHPAYAQKHVDIIKNAERITLKEVIEQTEAYYRDHDKGKGSGYKAFKRREYFHRMMMDEDQDVKSFDRENYSEIKSQIQRRRSDARVGGPITAGSWQQVGPAYTDYPNFSGRINTVVVDPANNNFIYVGQRDVASLYKSTDAGVTYTNVPTGMNIQDIARDQWHYDLTIAVSPTDANAVWLGGIDLYRSADGGLNWTYDYIGHVDFIRWSSFTDSSMPGMTVASRGGRWMVRQTISRIFRSDFPWARSISLALTPRQRTMCLPAFRTMERRASSTASPLLSMVVPWQQNFMFLRR